MKATLIYDINACPEGLPLEKVAQIFEERKIVLWDSSNYEAGIDPSFAVKVIEGDTEIKIIDVSKEEGFDINEYKDTDGTTNH